MAIKLPSHLHRSPSGILHFRIAIPPDVRHHFGTKEIYRSLHTASVRQATHGAQTLAVAFRHVFNEIRQQSMSDPKKAPKNPLNHSQFDLIVEFDFDELRRPKNVKLQSEPHHTPDAMQAALATILGSASVMPGAASAESKSTQAISTYIEPYLNSTHADHRPNAKTLESYRAAITTFIKIVGDKPLHELSVQDQNRFEDVIVRLPVNSHQAPSDARTIDQ